MKYIKLFQEHSGYTEFAASEDFLLHNVSYCKSSEHVHYDPDYSKEYFTVEALEDGTLYLWYAQDFGESGYLEYSLDDGQNWTRVTNVDGQYVEVHTPLTTGQKALIRGENTVFGYYGYGNIQYGGYSFGDYEEENVWVDKRHNLYGNIMSLLYGADFENAVTFPTPPEGYGTFVLFLHDRQIVDAGNLILPATTLTSNCYNSMFYGCTSLTAAPELPATTLAESCYSYMFEGCTSLTTAPALPATTLIEMCYSGMFVGCTSLTTAPELPATTLAGRCYTSMFGGCTSLTSAPALPATTLADYCYAGMFHGCTSLTTAPVLPATTLASYCYNRMFNDCYSLNYIKCLATDISASYCTYEWNISVSETGTFVKNPNMSSWSTGGNGIPNGWTVQDAVL